MYTEIVVNITYPQVVLFETVVLGSYLLLIGINDLKGFILHKSKCLCRVSIYHLE